MVELRHNEAAFAEQLVGQPRLLSSEAHADDARLVTVPLRPWIVGQPHRIGALRHLASQAAWPATAAQVSALRLTHQASHVARGGGPRRAAGSRA